MKRYPRKAAYVKRQGQTRDHVCHWPGCKRQVPPAMWGCSKHWFTIPAALRAEVWRTFKEGQEVNGTPSAEYVATARKVQDWIKQHLAGQATAGDLFHD